LNQWQIEPATKQIGAIEHKAVRPSLAAELCERERGELHVHMNGAIPVSTIRDILADELVELPYGFVIERDLVRHTPCPITSVIPDPLAGFASLS
jgi:adenosine deaminase